MKPYFSIFALSARTTLLKLIGVIALMGIVEIGLFYFAMDNESYGVLLEDLMDNSFVQYAFAGGFILYFAVLLNIFNGKHTSKAAMTTARLSVKEAGVCWTMSIYNMCALVIFLAAQLGIVLILCQMYLRSDLAGDYQHTVFIAFYRNGMMHGLLPLEDYWTYAENAIFVVGLGICASYSAKKQRRGKQDILSVVVAAIVALTFCDRADYYTSFSYSLVMIPMTAYAAYAISKGGALDEDEDETAAPDMA